MPVVVKLIAWADGRPLRHFGGWYIKEVDVQIADKSQDWLVPTFYLEEARRWPSPSAFFKIWKEVLESDPIRPDGEPNRPLTALTVEIVDLVEEIKSKQKP